MKLRQFVITLLFYICTFATIDSKSLYETYSASGNKNYNSTKRHNLAGINVEVTQDKRMFRDSETGLIMSECYDDYNVFEKLNMLGNTEERGPSCSSTNDYSGACWVQPLEFSGGRYRIRVCNQEALGYAECKDLSAGETSGNFTVESQSFDESYPGYQGGYGNVDSLDDCPDIKNNINGLGYVYIYEATDPNYSENVNEKTFINTYCKEVEERYNPGYCESPNICPCDSEECRKNNFMPKGDSKQWKNATQLVKNCYQCLKKYRAVHYYCRKIYNCLHKYKINSEVYNLATAESTRLKVKQMYGRGYYLCGYYKNNICGCSKVKLASGPRHFQRVVWQVSEDDCLNKDDFKKYPQCNMFGSSVYVRQFRNEIEYNNDATCINEKELKAELGYKERGTFFSPRLVIVAGKNERNIQFDSGIFDVDYADFYYNQNISENEEDRNNNTYSLPTSKKIIFGNFYPVIYEIGNMYQALDENDQCIYKPSGYMQYVMLRMEYNIATNESSLVAYRVRFVNRVSSSMEGNKRLKGDGSFSQFISNNSELINLIKNAQNIQPSNVADRTFIYSPDPNQNFTHKPIPIQGSVLMFENIGKVVRPPLKYTYDEGSRFINSPLYLTQDVIAMSNSTDLNASIMKISLMPGNLAGFKGDEFKSDKLLQPITKQIQIAGFDKAINIALGGDVDDDKKLSSNSSVIMYGKRFSVGYTNPCVFLKKMSEEYLKNPPKSADVCNDDSLNTQQRVSCFTSFALHEECQGYMGCLMESKSIAECQSEGRTPVVKITGSDNLLNEYKKNTDFRAKTSICVTEGFEFADKLSKFSNTKLFGDFGDPKIDYTIRWKKNKHMRFSSYPSRPVTIKPDTANTVPSSRTQNDPQDLPDHLITMNDDYFSGYSGDRDRKMVDILKHFFMLDENSMKTKSTVYDYYASECDNNIQTCIDKFEVAHRYNHETLSNLCIDASSFNSGRWSLPARDLGVDYHLYIPLRCQFVGFNGMGAGGAGFTSYGNGYQEDESFLGIDTISAKEAQGSNCLSHWLYMVGSMTIYVFGIIPIPIPCFHLKGIPVNGWAMPVYFNIPKYDATGSSAGSVGGVVDIMKLPIFDGYLSLTIGARTLSIKGAGIKKRLSNEGCFVGPSPYSQVLRNTGMWTYFGGTHAYWKYYVDVSNTSREEHNKDLVDYRKGLTELAFDNHNASPQSNDPTQIYRERIKEQYKIIYNEEKRNTDLSNESTIQLKQQYENGKTEMQKKSQDLNNLIVLINKKLPKSGNNLQTITESERNDLSNLINKYHYSVNEDVESYKNLLNTVTADYNASYRDYQKFIHLIENEMYLEVDDYFSVLNKSMNNTYKLRMQNFYYKHLNELAYKLDYMDGIIDTSIEKILLKLVSKYERERDKLKTQVDEIKELKTLMDKKITQYTSNSNVITEQEIEKMTELMNKYNYNLVSKEEELVNEKHDDYNLLKELLQKKLQQYSNNTNNSTENTTENEDSSNSMTTEEEQQLSLLITKYNYTVVDTEASYSQLLQTVINDSNIIENEYSQYQSLTEKDRYENLLDIVEVDFDEVENEYNRVDKIIKNKIYPNEDVIDMLDNEKLKIGDDLENFVGKLNSLTQKEKDLWFKEPDTQQQNNEEYSQYNEIGSVLSGLATEIGINFTIYNDDNTVATLNFDKNTFKLNTNATVGLQLSEFDPEKANFFIEKIKNSFNLYAFYIKNSLDDKSNFLNSNGNYAENVASGYTISDLKTILGEIENEFIATKNLLSQLNTIEPDSTQSDYLIDLEELFNKSRSHRSDFEEYIKTIDVDSNLPHNNVDYKAPEKNKNDYFLQLQQLHKKNFYHLSKALCGIFDSFRAECLNPNNETIHNVSQCGMIKLSNDIIVKYNGQVNIAKTTYCVKLENNTPVECESGSDQCTCVDTTEINRKGIVDNKIELLHNNIIENFKRIIQTTKDASAIFRVIGNRANINNTGNTSHEILFQTNRGLSPIDDRIKDKSCAASISACFGSESLDKLKLNVTGYDKGLRCYKKDNDWSQWWKVCEGANSFAGSNTEKAKSIGVFNEIMNSLTSRVASIGQENIINTSYLAKDKNNNFINYVDKKGEMQRLSTGVDNTCFTEDKTNIGKARYDNSYSHFRANGPGSANTVVTYGNNKILDNSSLANISINVDDSNLGYLKKNGSFHNNTFEKNDGAGGFFIHHKGTGAGGSGRADVTLDTAVEQIFVNGEYYPKLLANGSKIIGGTLKDQRCSVKCPPVFVKVNSIPIFFSEIDDYREVDMVCEYSGEPEDDMEPRPNTTHHPRKCYVMTERVRDVGYVKGKIFTILDGVCPIAKCPYGVWKQEDAGETSLNRQPNVKQIVYDRKIGLCKPKTRYGLDTEKSSWYYNMMFNKNMYSGMSYTGGRGQALVGEIYQNNRVKSFDIATCATTGSASYIIDVENQLKNASSLTLYCNESGFWQKNGRVGNTGNIPINSLYSDTISDDDYERNIYNSYFNAYKTSNENMNTVEYLIKDVRYKFNKNDGFEFSDESGEQTSGIQGLDNYLKSYGEKLGRILFKDLIYCPMIDADRYDFDEGYSGNANWDFTKEHNTAVSTGCKNSFDTIYVQSKFGPPTRRCGLNGIWGTVQNPCLKGCPSEEIDGIYWRVDKDLMQDSDGNSVTVYGSCFGNYLNSQNIVSTGGNGSYSRVCNLLTGTWGNINTGNCNDGIVTLQDNYNGISVATPYARVFNFAPGNTYQMIMDGLNDGSYEFEKKTKLFEPLYLVFSPVKRTSDYFLLDHEDDEEPIYKDFYQTNTNEMDNYVDVSYQYINISANSDEMYVKDSDNNILIDGITNTVSSYIVIFVKNTITPFAYGYMLAQNDEERNEFLNVENWLNYIKEENMNFTGQWAWKANMNSIRTKGVYNSTRTKSDGQQLYKNTSLLVFLPNNHNIFSNFENIALFSPYLAQKYLNEKGIYSFTDAEKEKVARFNNVENKMIKFRYPLQVDLNKFPMLIYNGLGSSYRLYGFQWDKNNNQDWGEVQYATHTIGTKGCTGKFFGQINHNTTKHIMYTSIPNSDIQTFASLYCYDGRIFGFHAFQTKILQDTNLTDENTKTILLGNDKNGYNTAYQLYYEKKTQLENSLKQKMRLEKELNNEPFDESESYFSNANDKLCGVLDTSCGVAKNAYVAGMMKQYWAKHILPEKTVQRQFIAGFRPDKDTHYTVAEDPIVQKTLKRYSEDNHGYYYRVVERPVEWISGIGNDDDNLTSVYNIIGI